MMHRAVRSMMFPDGTIAAAGGSILALSVFALQIHLSQRERQETLRLSSWLSLWESCHRR